MSFRPKYLQIQSFMFQNQPGQAPIVGWGKSVHRTCDSIAPRIKSIVSEMYSYREVSKNSRDELPPDTRYPWDDGLITISTMDEWGRTLAWHGRSFVVRVDAARSPEDDPSVFGIEYSRGPDWDGPDEDYYDEAIGVEELVKKILDYLWICQLTNVEDRPVRPIPSLQTLSGRVALTVRDKYGVPVMSPQDLQEMGIQDDLLPVKGLPQITIDEYNRSSGTNPFDYYHEDLPQGGPSWPSMKPFDFGKKRRRSRRKRKSI